MTKQTIDAEIFYRLRTISQLKDENIRLKLIEYLNTVKPKKLRSGQQNKSIHVDCTLIADKLNDAGLGIKEVITIDVPWTMENVKNLLFKRIMLRMFNKKSTTKLDKNTGEIDKIHDVLMRELGQEHGIEYHDFPHDPKKQEQEQGQVMPPEAQVEYPSEEALADKF